MYKFCLIAILIILGSGLIYTIYASEPDQLLQELEIQQKKEEIEKLKLENQQLKLAIDSLQTPSNGPSQFEQQLILSTITIIGSIIGVSVTALWTWYQSKKIPPLSDQEKFLRAIIKNDVDSKYKVHWNEIQNEILAENNDSKLEKYWKYIGNRDFPGERKKMIEKEHLTDLKDYVDAYNLESAKGREYKLSKSLTRSVYSEYFQMVEKKLPKLVSTAVNAAKPLEQKVFNNDTDIGTWHTNALKNLKWLMMLNGISEFQKTVELMIDAEIKKTISTARSSELKSPKTKLDEP